MDRTLRPRNRRKTDQPSKYVQQAEGEEELADKGSTQVENEVEEIETDVNLKAESAVALVSDKKSKGLKRKFDEETTKNVKRKSPDNESRGVKRKSPDDEISEGKTKEREATSSTTSPAAAKGSTIDEIIKLSLPPRKLSKREPEGPLLSIEEQKLMHTDVLTLLKRFSPKYYVPLPKIWAIPKSQLTTAQTQKT